MKTGRTLFVSSALFATAIAIAYWLVAREITGTFLLGFMAFALSFLAGYAIVGERDAALWGDRPDADARESGGSVIGTFTTRSPLPFWTGFTCAAFLVGLVVSPAIAALAFLAMLALGASFIMASR